MFIAMKMRKLKYILSILNIEKFNKCVLQIWETKIYQKRGMTDLRSNI